MLSFAIDEQKCTKCGKCVADCPAQIIAMTAGYPAIDPENEAACYKCQHCLAICPTAAVTILGLVPENSRTLVAAVPPPEQLETLIKGRRSVRRYLEENVDPRLIQQLLDVAWYAPTGVNSRQVQFTVVDDRAKMTQLREEIMAGLGRLVRETTLPPEYERFTTILSVWEDKGVDIIFRNAPHLLIASAPRQVVTPLADCLIALSYFDLYAQSNGIGTVWGGLAKLAIDELVPDCRATLGIPEDHLLGYVMMFGNPAIHYQRTVQHGPAIIHRM